MLGLTWLDLLLIISLISFLASGLRKGFFVTLGAIVGFLAGGIAAFYGIPLVSTWVTNPGWRIFWIVAAGLIFILIGQGIGMAIGSRIRLWLNFPVLKTFDRLLGGVANTVMAALVISAIALSAATMGVPWVSQQVADSRVLTTIQAWTPKPITNFVTEARAQVMGQTLPELFEPFAPKVAIDVPEPEDLGSGVEAAEGSVVKIIGTAYACGVNQSGSGFVYASDRVMTNAHVVAGITEPSVTTQDGQVLSGSVVYFDSVADIAVVEVPGLGLKPLERGEDLERGDTAAFLGYPGGGSFRAMGAVVESLSTVSIQNIYGAEPTPLRIYQLAAKVEQGNSGGPVLDSQGRVVGMVFAKAKGAADVGYALALEELDAALEKSEGSREAVPTGACSPH
ncbi:MarP family serine protease [Paeniglutamicibacter sulfureus]|uniref:MarP family serine protease n=1 Tax=Paeniglutamicibacter sulfureus TaxID=43666 RepID=UPI002665F787|nr:MarP family serine protease [Paeniglutamicibacter sulfureus]MDO2935298.1 MarP family serine protease [Paeniglutamicibacter sulfureus]